MIGCDAKLISVLVADNNIGSIRIQVILFAQICSKLDSLFVHLLKVRLVLQIILTDLKADIPVISGSPTMPTAIIPRKRLICAHFTVFVKPDECVNTRPSSGPIPVVIILVVSEFPVIRLNIPFNIRIIRACRMPHNALRSYLLTCFVTIIFC